MGKTNLIPLLTYFTPAECAERKTAAQRAGLSISNFNRAAMGYAAFKPGKPKKKSVPAESAENSISFEVAADSAEKSGEFENSAVSSIESSSENSSKNAIADLRDLLPTEADVEDAFSNLMGMTETGSDDETAIADPTVEVLPVSRTPERITEKLTERITAKAAAKVKEIERKDFTLRDQNNSLEQNENLSQPSLFS